MDRPVTRAQLLNPDDIVRGAREMLPQVVDLEPLSRYRLRLAFSDGQVRTFDLTPYLEKGIFQRLRDEAAFRETYIDFGSVEWPAGVGLHHETLYLKSTPEETAQ